MQPERRQRILSLALPIIGGMVSQNVLNLVDAAMVGSLGNAALAGVGIGGFLNFLLSSVVLGLGAGVQAMAARRVGEGRTADTAVPLNGGLLLALLVAVPWSVLLIVLAPIYFPWVASDSEVVAQGVPYTQARLGAMVALGMNFAFRGYWNAVDDSMVYMRTLIGMHVINIALNWVLIYGNLGAPALGTAGAGLATSIATTCGTIAYGLIAWKKSRAQGFLRGLPDKPTMRTMWHLSVPASLQQLFFAGGMTVLLAIIGMLGTAELAAAKVVIDLLLVGILPGLGFGLAAASLVGQALGRGHPRDAHAWAWDVAKLACVVVTLIGVPALIFPDLILRGFLHDVSTRAIAVPTLRLVAGLLFIDAVGSVLMNSLLGAGDARRVMLVSVGLQWFLFLPVAYLVGPVLGGTLFAVFVCQSVYRAIQMAAFARMWEGGRWQAVKLA